MVDRPYHHGSLDRALIAACLQILKKEGVQGLTLRKVAKKARVSHTAPYRHFASKEQLLTAVAAEGFEKLAAYLKNGMGGVPMGTENALARAAMSYLTFAADNPQHLKLMFNGERTRSVQLERKTDQPEEAFLILEQILARGQQEGVIRRDLDVRTLAVYAWAAVHGLALLLIEGQLEGLMKKPENTEEIVRGFVSIFFDGMRPK